MTERRDQSPGLTVDMAGSVEPRVDPGPTPQSALVLTEEEWADLAEICRHYLGVFPTLTSFGLDESPGGEERWISTDRCRALANRVVEASA